MKEMNIDMILSSIAGFLLGISFKGFFEPILWKIMLLISPPVPDSFMPMFYPSLICGVTGGFIGFFIYTVLNKDNRQLIKKALTISLCIITVFAVMFFIHTSFLNYQLGKPITQINNQSRYMPDTIDISSQDLLMVEVGNRGHGGGQDLNIKQNNEYIKMIYDEVQGLQEEKQSISSDSTYYMRINYQNNKNYTNRDIWFSNEYAYERLNEIYEEIGYNGSSLYNKTIEIMNKCRTFDNMNQIYFSAQWSNIESAKEGNGFKDIKDIDLLFSSMSTPQNYNPNDEEQLFYGNFFNSQPINSDSGDIIALFYSFDTVKYRYTDVAIYDRTKKMIIFKDKNNQFKYVKANLDELF